MNSRKLALLAGAFAGPLFTLSWLLQGFVRSAYSSLRHPVSSLAIGEAGWIQAWTFFVSGFLLLVFAVGLNRFFKPLALSRWSSIFLVAAGLGLIGAGFFTTDPMNGYPPGTALMPTDFTLAGRLHRLFSALFFVGLPLAAISIGRWFSKQGKIIWGQYSRASAWAFLAAFVITTIAFLQVGPVEAVAGLLQRITITIGWLWVTLVALYLLQSHESSAASAIHEEDVTV